MGSKWIRAVSLALCLGMLAGCSGAVVEKEDRETTPFIDSVALDVVELEDEAVALSELPEVPVSVLLTAEASGVLVKKNAKAVIDYSNTADGYVMVQYTASTTKRLKVQVKGHATTYTYNLTQGEWTVFPLSDGNGSYQIKVFENTTGNKYSLTLSVTQDVTLKDEFAPFIRPNQYVNYTAESSCVAKAAELTREKTTCVEKVAAIYDYVIHTLTYDTEKAATVVSGYLPDLDAVMEAKKGICFDYAALMTGMLRSQGIPCKLVIGYAGTVYHAWISVWSEETGWIDSAIYFDGTAWQRMDPTYASTGGQSAEIMAYIADGQNYTVKYLY